MEGHAPASRYGQVKKLPRTADDTSGPEILAPPLLVMRAPPQLFHVDGVRHGRNLAAHVVIE